MQGKLRRVDIVDELRTEFQIMIEPVKPPGDHRRQGEVGIDIPAWHPIHQPRIRTIPRKPDCAAVIDPPMRSWSAQAIRRRNACKS